MSVLTYNGVALTLISTKEFSQKAVYDDSNSDFLYSLVTISVEATINAAVSPATGGENATETMERIKHFLLEPRRQLTFEVGNETLLSSPAAGKSVDVKNGPLPQECRIMEIVGTQTYLVHYTILTHIIDCASGRGNEILSNRWKETSTIDERAYTKWTRTGKIITRSDMTTNADTLRGLIVPPLRRGFRRKSSEYVLHENGLEMSYTITDEEVYIQPPAPAMKASGRYVESTSIGSVRHAEVSVRLEGPKTRVAEKDVLVRLAIAICVNKLRKVGAAIFDKTAVMNGGAISEDLYDNAVEVRFKLMMKVLRAKQGGVALDLSRFNTPPYGSDVTGQLGPDPGSRGTAALLLAADRLRDPCLMSSTLVTDPGGQRRELSGGAPKDPPSVVIICGGGPIPDGFDAQMRTGGDADLGIYTDYKVRQMFMRDMNKIQLASCGDKPDQGDVVVQLANPSSKIKVEWTAERVGAPPSIPDSYSDGKITEMLDRLLVTDEIELMPDGVTKKYRMSGIDHVAVLDAQRVTLQAALPPWMGLEAARDCAIPDGVLDKRILSPLGVGGGAGSGLNVTLTTRDKL